MKKKLHFILALLFVFSIGYIYDNFKKKNEYIDNEGFIHGTTYHISYDAPTDLHSKIRTVMRAVDASLSIYEKKSLISKINNNEPDVEVDTLFVAVFDKAIEISEKTDGAFDITVAPFVNAWGFGFKNKEKVDSMLIDSLKNYVGFEKVKIKNNRLIKSNPQTILDVSAIAKGFSVDQVSEYLDSENIANYMVEIGGEVRTKGMNPYGKLWRIGIDKPVDDPAAKNREIQEVVLLENLAVATSGNYRSFYFENGKKYAHTINPKTGFPVRHSLLSASVFAKDCMTADAFATAFMVLGIDKSMKIVIKNKNIEAYFIFEKDGKTATWSSDGVKKMILQ